MLSECALKMFALMCSFWQHLYWNVYLKSFTTAGRGGGKEKKKEITLPLVYQVVRAAYQSTTGWVSTTVLEVRSLRSRYRQGWLLLRAIPWLSPSFRGLLAISGRPWLVEASPWCLPSPGLLPVCTCLCLYKCPILIRKPVIMDYSCNHLNLCL